MTRPVSSVRGRDPARGIKVGHSRKDPAAFAVYTPFSEESLVDAYDKGRVEEIAERIRVTIRLSVTRDRAARRKGRRSK